MTYVSDASQIVFLLLSILIGAIAVKVFFFDGKRKQK